MVSYFLSIYLIVHYMLDDLLYTCLKTFVGIDAGFFVPVIAGMAAAIVGVLTSVDGSNLA